MKVVTGWDNIPAQLRGAYVTIGNFDGVHRGHQYIFDRLCEEARIEKAPTVVITFDPHPKMIIHPERRPFYLLTTLEEKIFYISCHGVEACVIIPFTKEFSQMTAGDFVGRILVEKLGVRKVVIGHDYTFGRGKEGNEAFLIERGNRWGFTVEVIPPFTLNGVVVSSTRIREAILAGNVSIAAMYLGRPYHVKGTIIAGHHRGSKLGFPTANIAPEKILVPADGVYAVRVHLGGVMYGGVMNIGTNPTFDDGERSLEVFLLDFTGEIYGREIEVLFIERLRGERKFPSPEELIKQIATDVDRAKEILASP